MVRLNANLSLLFTEYPFLERFEPAALCGFKAIEFWFPYTWEKAAIKERLDRYGLELVLHNIPGGDWESGERGLACIPGEETRFRELVSLARDYAVALNCPRLNCPLGIAPPGIPPVEVRKTLVNNLRFAADALKAAGISLMIEPLNTQDTPGYCLTHTRDALDLIGELGRGNVRIQYDVYHMQVMEGDLINTIRNNLPDIGHIQIADNPGRHEPGTGEINFHNLLRSIDEAGYEGWVSCEYKPRGATRDSFIWAGPYLK